MNWLQFTASVIGSLAWPLAVVTLGFTFKEQVNALLAKMKSLKAPGGIEASFSEKVLEVVDEAKKLEAATVPILEHKLEEKASDQIPLPAAPQTREWRRRHREAVVRSMDERPAALVLTSWTELEQRIKDLVVATDTGCGVASPEDAIMRLADERWKIIDKPTEEVLLNLLRLRNQVAHVNFEPNRSAALNFASSAHRVQNHLEALLDEWAEHHREQFAKNVAPVGASSS
ncbi:MAG: hypothetical protein JSR41_00745 [Proteobacteria bacterium]|nr:hypothetical protein [Pseudomonadota bacterium]